LPEPVEDVAPRLEPAEAAGAEKSARRKIPGNLPYTSSAGVLRRVLEQIPTVEKPAVFTTDFLSTVMQATGGAARPVIPIFKSVGLLQQNGTPSDLYSQFQTSSGRATAALQALKTGFAEIFKRNTFAHKADKPAITDIVVAITGLPRSDKIVGYIVTTFQTLQDFAKGAAETSTAEPAHDADRDGDPEVRVPLQQDRSAKGVGLVYNINVVLPETTNVEVFSAIFKSLKANLLS